MSRGTVTVSESMENDTNDGDFVVWHKNLRTVKHDGRQVLCIYRSSANVRNGRYFMCFV